MIHESLPKEHLKELLDEFLQTHYDGSFSRMVSEYIRATVINYYMNINQLGFDCICKLSSSNIQ